MRNLFLVIFYCLFLLPVYLMGQAQQTIFNARNEAQLVLEQYRQRQARLARPFSKIDRGAGVLDRGELSNVVGNFGIISNFHLFAPAFHWPSWADYTHQYCFGLELLVGVKGDVVTSIHDPATVAENYDWEAKDGSLGQLFSGEVKLPDGTPMLASSDNPATWPRDASGNPFWPGPFRIDPLTGKQVKGEFVSERDVYAEFTDQNNLNGPYGLEVHQTAYSFSRSYARNFLIFDFWIYNTSNQELDSVWVGYMADFKVDYDAHDLIRFIALDEGTAPDIVYLWDSDPNSGAWDITGYIGFLTLFTPRNKGITDFHYFDNIYEPSTNEQIWEIMSSDTSGAHITVSNFFHGKNRRIDDTDLAPDMDPSGQGLGTDFVFILATGPLTLAPGDSVHSAFAVVMGGSEDEMLANARMAKSMAQQHYLGPNAPQSPIVQAFPGDGKVILTWDGTPSETSRDLLTQKMDFEGYRIYRSEDFGQSWGKPITDEKGNVIGYVPIAQFDLDDDVSGKDPNSNFFLGNNTGIRHTFVDTTVVNGVEYWYTVTAYDRGDPVTGTPALESPRGITPDEPNTVRVIPSGMAQGIAVPEISMGDSLPPLGGQCDSRLAIQVIDPSQLTGHRYRVTFNDVGWWIAPNAEGFPDTVVGTTFNLIDLTTGDTLLWNHPLLNNTGDNVPVTDGFRVLAKDATPEVTFLGWTLVHGDTCTYDWRVHNYENYASHPWVGPEAVYTSDDFRLTVDYAPDGGSQVQWYDMYYEVPLDTFVHIPLRIEVITDPDNPVEVGSHCYLAEYEINSDPSWHDAHYSPLGWDLEPGGAGYNPNFPWRYLWSDILILENPITDPKTGLTRHSGLYLLTENFPDQYLDQNGQMVTRPAVKPSQGDQFEIHTRKLFRSQVYYEFEMPKGQYNPQQVALSQIKVVPNPYIVRAGWERSAFEGRLQFTNLPPECDIIIFTTAGERVKTIHHKSSRNFEFWNLQNESGINVAYGLYVYVVKTPDGKKHVGRFVIIK